MLESFHTDKTGQAAGGLSTSTQSRSCGNCHTIWAIAWVLVHFCNGICQIPYYTIRNDTLRIFVFKIAYPNRSIVLKEPVLHLFN